jgi:hypothetical protein
LAVRHGESAFPAQAELRTKAESRKQKAESRKQRAVESSARVSICVRAAAGRGGSARRRSAIVQ